MRLSAIALLQNRSISALRCSMRRLRSATIGSSGEQCDIARAISSSSTCLYELGQKGERAPYGRVEESLGGDPHTLPESVRSSCTPKKPKLLTQHASPMLVEKKI